MWLASILHNQDDNTYNAMGGEFTLKSAYGSVNLSDFADKWVVIYFGFMSCPDVCPTALSSLAAAIRSLEASMQARMQPLFISVDPARDTLTDMRDYTAYFYPTMLGLTGELPYLEKLAQRYGAFFHHVPLKDSAMPYTVDHSSRLYVVDPDGKLVNTIPHGTSIMDIALVLQQHLSKYP